MESIGETVVDGALRVSVLGDDVRSIRVLATLPPDGSHQPSMPIDFVVRAVDGEVKENPTVFLTERR